MFLTTAAGLPRTSIPGATFSVTTLPAATTLPLPISTPGAMNACAATHDPERNVIGFVCKSKVASR
ncbi:MAG: hypothetical protein QOD99_2445 [Chthoniobacter sp.]|nr:hypothetical protein [Chthoniobacter sp.]